MNTTKTFSLIPLFCIFNMTLPWSRWPPATRKQAFELHSPSLTLLGPIWSPARQSPSQPCQNGRPSFPSVQSRESQAAQSSQVAANIDSGRLAAHPAKPLLMSSGGRRVFAFLTTNQTRGESQFSQPCRETQRGSDFRKLWCAPVFRSSRMVRRNKAADGWRHRASSLTPCGCFLTLV